jgi:coenzyme F420-reducing hydrogenase beta subunit
MVCPDFSAEYADISFGGLGSPEGYTTVLIRSEMGKWIYRGALTAGYLKEKRSSSVQKARSDWMKTNTKVISFSDQKKVRALKNRHGAAIK